MSKDYVLISTDLEPDDISFLRIFIKRLNDKFKSDNEFPQVQILVGEGKIPDAKIKMVEEILEAAVKDGILNQELMKYIEVLGGSSIKRSDDTIHRLYNQSFFNVSSMQENEQNIALESRKKIVQAIANTKEEAGKVTIFGLKPFTDLPMIIEQTKSLLQDTDELYISGSYNFRAVHDNDIANLNKMLNTEKCQITVFEGYHTYESKKDNVLPKEIMYIDNSDSFAQQEINRLAHYMRNDESNFGKIHKSSIESWNKAVAYDCMVDCIKPLLEYKDKIEYELLNDLSKNLEKDFVFSQTTISSFVAKFIESVSEYTSTILTGNERDIGDYSVDFTQKFENLNLENFNWNWKVLGSIAKDPSEMLIGDATLAAIHSNPELFETKTGKVERQKDISYTICTEDKSKHTSWIDCIGDYKGFINNLEKGMNL